MTFQSGLPYEWDESKSQSNLRSRGFGFELIHPFDQAMEIAQQDSRSTEEHRWISTGLVEERLYVTVWTQRGTTTRVISLGKGPQHRGRQI